MIKTITIKIIIVILTLLVFNSMSIAADKPQSNKLQSICPKTKMSNECLTCHTVPHFKLKETLPDAMLVYPVKNMRILGWEYGDVNKLYALYELNSILPDEVMRFFEYVYPKGIKKVVFEIFSPGGSLFGAQKIVSMIEEYKAKGNIVETRIYGAALSAGFYIFVSGSPGHRLVSPYADLMWHELISLKGIGFVFESPSDSEESSRVLRHLQNIRNEYIASRSKLTKAQIDEKIRKKEFWMSGKQAVEYGFADGFIGSEK